MTRRRRMETTEDTKGVRLVRSLLKKKSYTNSHGFTRAHGESVRNSGHGVLRRLAPKASACPGCLAVPLIALNH